MEGRYVDLAKLVSLAYRRAFGPPQTGRCENNVVFVRSPLIIRSGALRAACAAYLTFLAGTLCTRPAAQPYLPERSGVNDLISRKITISQRAVHIHDLIGQRHQIFDADPRH